MTIIETTKGYVFGAYAAVSWDSTSGYKSDKSAFIFSLVNERKHPIFISSKTDSQTSVECKASYGPTFGTNDIYISSLSNISEKSFSGLGKSYDFTLFAYETSEADSFLAGSYHFKTSEIEVIQLI